MMSEQRYRSTDDANWGGESETEIESYRTVCITAFCALGLGLLSPLAFAFPLMYALPVVGVVVAIVALRRIARDPDRLIGRRAALVGLAASVLIGIGAPTRVLTHRWVVLRQTRHFAEEWFAHLREGNPHMSLEMTHDIKKRRPLDDNLWRVYRDNPNDAEELRKYVREPVVAALLALGDSATVRHYDTQNYTPIAVGDAVEEVYAVTYQENGRPKTFFVNLSLGRDFEPYKGVIPLRVFHASGGAVPDRWQQANP